MDRESWILEWLAAPRPPVHPRAMTGSRRFETFDRAIAFMAQQDSDAIFISLTRERVFLSDWSDAALAVLREKGGKIR